jgi:hypothetical protein
MTGAAGACRSAHLMHIQCKCKYLDCLVADTRAAGGPWLISKMLLSYSVPSPATPAPSPAAVDGPAERAHRSAICTSAQPISKTGLKSIGLRAKQLSECITEYKERKQVRDARTAAEAVSVSLQTSFEYRVVFASDSHPRTMASTPAVPLCLVHQRSRTRAMSWSLGSLTSFDYIPNDQLIKVNSRR